MKLLKIPPLRSANIFKSYSANSDKMRIGKPQSKRVPVRLRHKIEKASTAKQRKQRKEAKKNPQWRSRLKKDPGIPNLFPYKAKVLAEIEESKRKKEEELQRRKDVAKAQRLGTVIPEVTKAEKQAEAEEEDDELLDDAEEDADEVEDEEMEVQNDSNPMAALLASAQARAQVYSKEDKEEAELDDDDDDDEWNGVEDETTPAPSTQAKRKTLPKQALADPIKAVSTLLERMQQTQDGIQQLINHYDIPPLATASTDLSSRFLVEVARKRGRLGRGGVPNLHAAALTVLSDLQEERLQLPSAEVKTRKPAAAGKGEVQIVAQMAEPFRLEGLWGGEEAANAAAEGSEMVVES